MMKFAEDESHDSNFKYDQPHNFKFYMLDLFILKITYFIVRLDVRGVKNH